MFASTVGSVAGASISIDQLVVNQRCPNGKYSELMTGTCLPCSANTLSASGCVESWEGAGVAAPAASVAPSYNSWQWGACAAGGVSGPSPVTSAVPVLRGASGPLLNTPAGSAWDATPPSTADGLLYAFLPDSCAITRTVANLAGTWAVLELWYTFRYTLLGGWIIFHINNFSS